MGELHVTRWRKYGKDRLYVNDAAGQRVGWVDLPAGIHTLEQPQEAAGFAAAVHAFCAQHDLANPLPPGGPVLPAPRDAAPRLDVPTPASAPAGAAPAGAVLCDTTGAAATDDAVPEPAPAWQDLALNVPGQAARAQAEAELAAMRDRSRVGTFLARAFDLKTDERAWRVGAGGEETVGARLEKLRRHGWHVLHAVPVGERGSDIDHVLIGSGGVWTLNTKTHPGGQVWVGRHQVRVNGHRTDYLRNSRHEAERASRLLTEACGFPVLAEAALVFLTGTLIPNVTVKQQPEDVAVLDRTDIPGAFRRATRRLGDEQVAAVFEQARRSTTWQR
jgi:hypothetical protein